MAKETILDPYYLGTDFGFPFLILNKDETASLDITAWSLSFMYKADRADLDGAALLTKTTALGGIAIAGTFDASPDPTVNLQRATVSILDTDTDSMTPRIVYWELKRTDPGVETVLADGTQELRRGVHRT
jgi:hypothetical protein